VGTQLYDMLQAGVAMAPQRHAAQVLPYHVWGGRMRKAQRLRGAFQVGKSDLTAKAVCFWDSALIQQGKLASAAQQAQDVDSP
jgi:hypothetical protein